MRNRATISPLRSICLAQLESRARAHVRSVNEALRRQGFTEQQIVEWWELQLLRQKLRKDKKKGNETTSTTNQH